MKLNLLFVLIACFLYQQAYSQQNSNITWWNPAQHEFNVIGGQGWPENVQYDYDRLPKEAEAEVRKSVWNLSKHAAGLVIRFRSNSSQIKIRYKVAGKYAMPHMPATGVSGVDLYTKNSDGEWMWCRGRYAFGDTARYDFTNINPQDAYHDLGREYQLYLPLYNSVEWLEIGVHENTRFEPLPIRHEKPIVVYGTSIAQGACASRPGMAWTSILERKLDNPLINLAFSGNGRLEEELIDLISQIDAKIYILDCLPNLSPNKDRTLEEVRRRIISSVGSLRKTRANVPILLVEHAGYSDGSTNLASQKTYTDLNKVLRETYAWLKAEGTENIYLLTKDEIKLGLDDFVDGTHPSDLGMMHYAAAYEKYIRRILFEPIGKSSTTIPVTQRREPGNYDWEERHQVLLKMNKANSPKICFFGNSITHFWGGAPLGPFSNGGKTWDKNFKDLGVRNFGFGWDRIENALWRVYHEELDGFDAEQVVVMLGTNNLHLNTDEEIIEGLELLAQAIKVRQANAKISLIGLLPRIDQEARINKLNLKISKLAGTLQIHYTDIGNDLLNEDGKINESFFSDGLHPNVDGYRILGPVLRQYFSR
jgi:lysophospholipase L1-like esterase